MKVGARALSRLQREVVECRLCPRLIQHCQRVAVIKRRAYRDWDYWGLPVPSFGDPNAHLLIVGLAPAAHGANRTGRIFTGDRSGDFLYRALFETGFASQPASASPDDGLELRDAYITAVVRCAPPENKPLPIELRNCSDYFKRELDLLPNLRVVVALGRIAFDAFMSVLLERGLIQRRSAFRFGHDLEHRTGPGQPLLISSYHPSQQNTSTGRLTPAMLLQVFLHARQLLAS